MNRMMTVKEVSVYVGLSRPTLYKLMSGGIFPRGVKLTSHAVRWSTQEVDDWLAARPRSEGNGARSGDAAA